MNYNKNHWIKKYGYEKAGGQLYLPVNGKKILNGSSINRILLNEKPLEKIELHGKLVVLLSGETINEDDFSEELVQFLESTIVEAKIEKVWTDKQGSLTVDIDSNPTIRIFVSNEGVEWPIEKWTYDHEGGYISN